ncbi:hypothetical protein DOTSEDRAFT_147019 [Dothistroma septosporum NZE10]|uniref:Large ribosomal subunit protein mL67 n=1 Tax=Dothistroma septosporum (strain NZE10 / CBS 128990) TaxID=675120 RepID=N1Q0E4_DOTSN|nr:hypothetical protein DOTSEDRAFT_147019 [Dothistroma septosporum NZE10]
MGAVAQEVIPHGRFIYAFCNVRTNQVLYSLSRTLDNSALKQLPDLGANHTPPVLRKDLWRPLYRVELPSTPEGVKQGLHAIKKLREYRKLHELSWEQTSLMTRNFTDKEIETEKKKLENRGGSKKETVYDIIKRQKHKMKVKMVMDQKANSIADLAAVLLEQEALGAKTLQAKETRAREWRATQLEEMEGLAHKAEGGGMDKVSDQVDLMQKTLEQMRKDGTEGQRSKLKKEIADTKRQLRKMRHAVHVTIEVNPKAGEIERLAQSAEDDGLEKNRDGIEVLRKLLQETRNPAENKSLKDQIRNQEQRLRLMQSAANAVQELRATSAPTEEGTSGDSLVAAYKKELLLSFAEDPTERDQKTLPKRGWARREVDRRNRPTFTAEGITVKWANIMDVEYAGTWPDAVHHERMGFTTRNVPLVDSETVAEYKALQWKGRRENFQLQEGIADKVERIRAEMGLRARDDKPWKFDQIEELESGILPGNEPSVMQVSNAVIQDGEIEAVQEVVEEAIVEGADRLETIQMDILGQVPKKAAREWWDKRAELDLRKAMNKYKLAPPPSDLLVGQQPTA